MLNSTEPKADKQMKPAAKTSRLKKRKVSRLTTKPVGKQDLNDAPRQIAYLEQDLWRIAFSRPSRIPFLVVLVNEQLASNSSFQDIDMVSTLLAKAEKQAEKANRNGRSKAIFDETITSLSQKLWEIDRDRDLIELVKQEAIRTNTKNGAIPQTVHLPYHIAIKEAAHKVQSARHLFLQDNQGLVVRVARQYVENRTSMQLNDLIQEGNLGLIKGLDRFDYRKGNKFSTYAIWWIQSAIGRALTYRGYTVRIPASAIRKYVSLKKTEKDFTRKTGRQATVEEIAKETGIDSKGQDRIKEPFSATRTCSLDDKVSSGYNTRYVDIISDNSIENPEEQTALNIWSGEIDSLLEELTPRERMVIRCRFGLDNFEEMSLAKIGGEFGVSRERIRQIQENALDKMRQKLENRAA